VSKQLFAAQNSCLRRPKPVRRSACGAMASQPYTNHAPAQPDAAVSVDLTASESEAGSTANTGRPSKDVWDMGFTKVPLEKARKLSLKRNYDAICDSCGDKVPGRPDKLKAHLRTCSKVDSDVKLKALTESAHIGEENASQTKLTDVLVDNTKISKAMMIRLHKLLTLAFIMCGWAFRGVLNPAFIGFLAALRANYSPPSEHYSTKVTVSVEPRNDFGNSNDDFDVAALVRSAANNESNLLLTDM